MDGGSRKIKLFIGGERFFPARKHCIMLSPFSGSPDDDPHDPDAGRFDEFAEKGRDFFALTADPQSADFFLLPFDFVMEEPFLSAARKFSGLAAQYGKKLIVFFNSDFDHPVPLENAIVFRTSFCKSRRLENEFAVPGWSVDFSKVYSGGKEKLLGKESLPRISYCGYVDSMEEPRTGIFQKIKSVVRGKETDIYRMGPALRGKAVRKLLASKGIQTDFIIRNGFWAEGIEDKNAARKEYAQNMLGSPYALVARGAGNFSYRLYEALSCGRIPVFINTDCVLPFENQVDWKKHMLWIEENDVEELNEHLLDFHRKLKPDDFVELQQSNRKLYEEWISPTGFFKNLYRILS